MRPLKEQRRTGSRDQRAACGHRSLAKTEEEHLLPHGSLIPGFHVWSLWAQAGGLPGDTSWMDDRRSLWARHQAELFSADRRMTEGVESCGDSDTDMTCVGSRRRKQWDGGVFGGGGGGGGFPRKEGWKVN